MSFAGLVGQHEFKTRVAQMIEGNLPQSFLITGADGIGKHVFARELAKTLICEHPTKEGSCGVCTCCKYFEAGTHPDFKLIEADEGRKNIRIADLRSSISSDIMINPQIAARKVYLINAQQLGNDSQNLLLKSLEEPPKGVAFILICSDSSRIIPTIMSRITELKLRSYTGDEIKTIVTSVDGGKELPQEKLDFIAGFSSGIPGRAITLITDEEFAESRDKVFDLVIRMPELTLTDILVDEFQYWDKNHGKIDELLLLLLWTLGDLSLLLATVDRSGIKNKDKEEVLIKFLKSHPGITLVNISAAAEAVTEFAKGLKVNVNFEAACCSMFLKIYKELAQ